MAPVKPNSTSPEVDNEATAELPVLDIAAYESTLNEPLALTDTFVMPASAAPVPDLEGTMEFVHGALESSHTLEMPALPPFRKTGAGARVKAGTYTGLPASTPVAAPPVVTPPAAVAAPPAAAAPPAPRVQHGPITIPPSPPMIEELRNALAAAERRIEELNERARIADTERGVAVGRANAEAAQLREQLGVHFEALSTAANRLDVQRVDEPELQDELFRRADRIAELDREIARQSKLIDDKITLLDASLRRGENLDAEIMNLRAGISRRDSQIAIIEADMQARAHREGVLNMRLSEALASIDPDIRDLRADIAASDEQVRRLNLELKAAKALAAEKNDDLQVAEESIRLLENEVRDKTGKLEEASVTVEEWRAVIAESQRSILQRDGRIQQLEADLDKRAALAASLDSAAQTGEEPALEGPARLLIRTDGNTDFVHVLGRRTRVGRGNDNELVLDTKHVSRYHAVFLAGPVHTSVEDLNSTNGVFVNGKRVARQVLKEGDRVTVGKTSYRYTVRD
jgi:hypothetical protein